MLEAIATTAHDPAHVHQFALCFEARLSHALREAKTAVDLLGPARLSRPLTIWRTRRRLAALLSAQGVDAAITHSPWIHALCGPVLRARHVRTVQWVHGPLEGWAHRRALRSRPDALIANSRFTQSQLPPEYASLPAEVIYCPLLPSPPCVPEDRADVRRELATAAEDVVVVQASRLEPWKGHMVLLRALAQLTALPGWTLWIVGGAQRPAEELYLQEIRALVARSGLTGRVRFAGERTDARRLLAAADIYCQPNLSPEPFGLAYVEAMAARLPVVASDGGGVREIVDAATGVLLPPGDAAALSSTLRALIREPERRQAMGAAGVHRASTLCAPATQLPALHRFIAQVTGLAA